MSYKETKTLLYVDNLTIGYEGKPVLENIKFEIKDIIRDDHESTGQVVVILGRSGRGKSTLFKALTGLLEPMSGEILISDLSENETKAHNLHEGDIGFVDQKYTLFRHKTVKQICEYALRKSKLSKEEKDKVITQHLTDWELLEHKDKYPNALSGGQRQRTAIIEQLLTDKTFIILDECTSGLDVVAVEKVKENIDRISNANENNTIILSTHDLKFALEVADIIHIIGFKDDSKVSTLVKTFDLKKLGLAWKEYGEEHIKLSNEIKEVLANS